MASITIIRIKDLEEIVGLSISTINRLEAEGKFPKRVKISKKLVGWKEEDICNWIAALFSSQEVKDEK